MLRTLLTVLLIALWAQHAVSIPHVNDCNYCTHCLLEDSITAAAQRTLHAVEQPAPGARPHDLPRASSERQQDEEELRQVMYRLSGNTGSGSASRVLGGAGSAGKAPSSAMHPIASAAWGHGLGPNMGSVSPVLHSPHNLSKSMIRPSDHQAKMLKPNCTRCYGCTTNLTDIKDEVRTFDRIKFVHGMGATNAWLFFAQPKGSAKRYIVKVFCMPYAKTHGRPKECSPLVYMDRVRLMMAHVALARDCGAPELTPRMWLAPVNAVVPNGTHRGYHIRWWGLWMEEAPGITLHALMEAQDYSLMHELLTRRMNKTQVLMQTVMDLLTAQCDRHGENIFITADGQLTFIDNDRSLGVVGHCAGDSVLLPGTRYHTWLFSGHYTPNMRSYYQAMGSRPGFCSGPVDPRIIMDYRCMTARGRLGRSYPPPFKACLKMLAGLAVNDIEQRYGFISAKPALILKTRAIDLLRRGFEATLHHGRPRSHPKTLYKHQAPCCRLGLEARGRGITCSHCWKPILEDQLLLPADAEFDPGEYVDDG